MSKKKYTIKVKYIFSGEFYITANSRAEAEEIADKDCGLVIGGDIHTTSAAVEDWDFNVHPEKRIS